MAKCKIILDPVQYQGKNYGYGDILTANEDVIKPLISTGVAVYVEDVTTKSGALATVESPTVNIQPVDPVVTNTVPVPTNSRRRRQVTEAIEEIESEVEA